MMPRNAINYYNLADDERTRCGTTPRPVHRRRSHRTRMIVVLSVRRRNAPDNYLCFAFFKQNVDTHFPNAPDRIIQSDRKNDACFVSTALFKKINTIFYTSIIRYKPIASNRTILFSISKYYCFDDAPKSQLNNKKNRRRRRISLRRSLKSVSSNSGITSPKRSFKVEKRFPSFSY